MRNFSNWAWAVLTTWSGLFSVLLLILTVAAWETVPTATVEIGMLKTVCFIAFLASVYTVHRKVEKDRDALASRHTLLQIFIKQAGFRLGAPAGEWIPVRLWLTLRFRNDRQEHTSLVINAVAATGFERTAFVLLPRVYRGGFGGRDSAHIVEIGPGQSGEIFIMADILVSYSPRSPPRGDILNGLIYVEGGHTGALAPVSFSARKIETSTIATS